MTRKTNVNNLTIVWQGQSWSVIAPDGHVLYRNVDKRKTVQFAKGNTDYVMDNVPIVNYVDDDFQEFRSFILSALPSRKEKRKNDTLADLFDEGEIDFDYSHSPVDYDDGGSRINRKKAIRVLQFTLGFSGLLLLTAGSAFAFTLDYGAMLSSINWIGLSIFGLLVLMILSILGSTFNEGEGAGCAAIFWIILALGLCNEIGLLARFLEWVF